MENRKIEKLKRIFEAHLEVRLVYLFGSQATGKTGPLSDYDFAVYIDEKDIVRMYDIQFKLMSEVSRELHTDKVDIVVLNLVESPEMKYNVIKEGILIYAKEPYKVLVETEILNEYFDFRSMLLRYNLTTATK